MTTTIDEPFQCRYCQRPASTLHSIEGQGDPPGVERIACSRCQGDYNQKLQELHTGALAALRAGRATAEDLNWLAANGHAAAANAYIAANGYPGRSVRDRTTDSND
jgi:hypothetical protein